MNIRIYRLSSSSTVTGVNGANTPIVSRGTIVGIHLSQAVMGAAAAGRISFEAALNNGVNGNAESASGAPSEVLMARLGVAYAITSSANGTVFVPLNIDVVPGNQLMLNVLQTGTAPSTAFHYADVQVKE